MNAKNLKEAEMAERKEAREKKKAEKEAEKAEKEAQKAEVKGNKGKVITVTNSPVRRYAPTDEYSNYHQQPSTAMGTNR